MSTTTGRRVSEDLRYELADAARLAEVANKPRSLLVLATVLFLIAGVALIWALREHEGAARQNRIQKDHASTMANLEQQFKVVAELAAAGASPGGERLLDLRSRIETAASVAGLANVPSIPQETMTVVNGLNKRTYTYKMQDPSLKNLLTWVEESRQRVPGLEVSSLEITPADKHWNFNITFVRWERPS